MKKIIIVSIFAALLVLSSSFIPVIHAHQQTKVTINNIEADKNKQELSDSNSITLDKTIAYSQKFIECFNDKLDEKFVEQLQNNLKQLNNEFSGSSFCDNLWATIELLSDYLEYLETQGAGLFLLASIWLIMKYLIQIYINKCEINVSCGCTSSISS